MSTDLPEALTSQQVRSFRRTIYRHFRQNGRRLPWRETADPYQILVSEIMLQQTQVARVLTKYEVFLARFPDFASLARASLREVLVEWQGLGHNRRAIGLQRIAQRIVTERDGRLPDTEEDLRTLPGIGPATAGALIAFAFQKPSIFVETNIRRVFIHSFFAGQDGVTDRQILPLVERTLDRKRVRIWYYALMDYGVMLRSVGPNPNRRSAHYARQAPFLDSDRQIRGLILKILMKTPSLSEEHLVKRIGQQEHRTKCIIAQLTREGFLDRIGGKIAILSRSAGLDPD